MKYLILGQVLNMVFASYLLAEDKYYVESKETTKLEAMKSLLNEENKTVMRCYQVKLSPRLTMIKGGK